MVLLTLCSASTRSPLLSGDTLNIPRAFQDNRVSVVPPDGASQKQSGVKTWSSLDVVSYSSVQQKDSFLFFTVNQRWEWKLFSKVRDGMGVGIHKDNKRFIYKSNIKGRVWERKGGVSPSQLFLLQAWDLVSPSNWVDSVTLHLYTLYSGSLRGD